MRQATPVASLCHFQQSHLLATGSVCSLSWHRAQACGACLFRGRFVQPQLSLVFASATPPCTLHPFTIRTRSVHKPYGHRAVTNLTDFVPSPPSDLLRTSRSSSALNSVGIAPPVTNA